ncbi:hypothetical protein D3C77_769840 [compost metagenome]
MLVVLHAHVIDACAKLAGNTGDLALNVSVVGTFIKAPLEIPVRQEGEGDGRHHDEEDRQAAFELCRHETMVPEM